MKKNTLKKLLTSLAITTLIIGLVAPTVVNGDEIEEPIVDEVEEVKTEEVNEKETEKSEDIKEEELNEATDSEIKQEVSVKAISDIVPLSASALIADTTTFEEAFPDTNFRIYIVTTILGNKTYDDSTDKGNTLSTADITKITTTTFISALSKEISSLEGIEYFTNLTSINVSNNKLTGILDLTSLSNLKTFQAHTNQLESLNVSGLDQLETIVVYNNKLAELKLSGNIKLTTLTAYNNKLTTIDVTNASNLVILQVYANLIESIDVSKNEKLETLRVDNNKLTGSLNLTHLSELKMFQAHTNQLESIDVSGLEKLETVIVYRNLLTELKLSRNIKLKTITAYINKLTTIDISDAEDLVSLELYANSIDTIDVSNNEKLETLRVDNNKLATIDLSKNSELITLNVNTNKLSGILDATHMVNLVSLQVNNNNLDDVNVTGLENLTTLYSHYNPNLIIDLSGINTLNNLTASKVKNADLSKLTSFYVSGSKPENSAMVRLLGAVGTFSWDDSINYYVISANNDAQYAIGLPRYDENGTFKGISVSSYIDLSSGSLMDDEGNLIIGAVVTDISNDGSITLDSGTVVTGDGVYEFTGEFTIKDGEITTGADYSYSKNIINEGGTVVVGGETTTITVPNGSEITIDANDSAKTVTYPAGSTVTNKDGDTIYVIDDIEMDSDGTISSGSYITVPNGTTVVDNGDGTVTIPKDMVVTIDDDDTVYPGEIIFDTSTGKTEYVPINGLITEDETNGTNLGDGVDEESLSKAEEILNSITDGKLKDQLEEIVNTVKDMLDASKEVNDMYDADGNLKSTVTEEMIKELEDIVNALPDGTFKDNLKDKVEEAQTTLNKRNEDAQDKVDNLFNEDKTDLGDEVGQTEIDEAQKAVDKLPNGDKKEELQKEIDKAQDMLDAKDAVNDLFNPDGSIKDGVTQDDINDALDLVNNLPDGSLKDELLNLIKEAQKEVDERTYVVLEGFAIFTGKGNVSTRIDAPAENFSKVYVNGKELDKSNYEVKSGSTIITLKESYLLTLENKTYDVEVEFVSGAKVSVPLTVNVKGNASIAPPTNSKPVSSVSSTTGGSTVNTGDSTDLTMLYAMFAISLVGVVVITKRKYVK
ncbi:toxin Cry1Ac domain D-VI-related protein [Breznakia pachnodae]|uniref:Pesticidal crystal protein Cry1Aa domain-containing protein n=1 Tax=Breznakia pachnodae TaxID=265178 RepID=A0ABU0DZL0_9FIRM|nr:toxin Cry1Ac domain D-VI-related protein [Breznakia pachnodae]MDQ0360070.1 hypothetical protein [Breznakia pachnodae]